MEPYTECFDKHLINFTKFADQFTKVFIPIIGTAVKMSTEEPVSAYSIYKASKDLSDNKKKSNKKNRKNSSNSKTIKGSVHKLACAPAASNSNTASKLKTKNVGSQGKSGSIKNKPSTNKTKHEKKVLQKKQKLADTTPLTHRFIESEINGFGNQLHTDDSRETINSLQKKKGLVEQFEIGSPDSDESFETVEMEDLYFDPKIYLDEFSINNEMNSSQVNESCEEELLSISVAEGEAAEALASSTTCSKANRKRKSPEGAPTKAICNNDVIVVTSESKKSKKIITTKTGARKSLSAAEELSRRRSSLASRDDNYKKLATKSATNVSTVANVKLMPLSTAPNIVKSNSIEEGKRAFKWLLNPLIVDDFFVKFWEQKACLIRRQQSDYFGHLISFEMIDQMLLKNHVEFTKNIDVTSYKNGFRETLNPEGRAFPPVVWDHYGQGCSIRLLNPQTFIPALFALSTTMQEYFQCLVGANAYLTPPNSQGFAPHYDDIEAFVLQIEGRKRWKLYKPRSTTEMLPRYSSKNFTQEEIGKPVMEEVLEPGDVLYFPRGTIHQACTEPGYHSLHITLSVYQKQSFADLFEKMLPAMLQKAIVTNVEMRRGLPLYAWQHAGIAFSENSTKERADFTKKVTRLVHKSIRDMPVQEIMDAAMDQLAKKFQHEALPPNILPEEKLRTVFGSSSRTNERGECVCDYDIDERTNLRLLRANILRLVEEEGKMRIYYYLDNSKEYCEYEPNFIEIEAMEAASIEVLIKSYPQYVGVSQLPLPSNDQKINLATALWERGLLMMEKPFR